MTCEPCAPYSRRIDLQCIAVSAEGSLYRRFSCSDRPPSSVAIGSRYCSVAWFVSMVVSSSKRSSSARKMDSSYWFLRIVLKLRSSVPVATDTHVSLRTSCSSGPRPDDVGTAYESGRMRYDVPCRRIAVKSRSRKLPPSAMGAADVAGGDATSRCCSCTPPEYPRSFRKVPNSSNCERLKRSCTRVRSSERSRICCEYRLRHLSSSR
mmetsp:Transcript_28547/g.73245  ORF Transcript_28547/g.73245 Transcript_28547/m.73245 type:complete len:208 (-) Transcript_28547:388-1011(-)